MTSRENGTISSSGECLLVVFDVRHPVYWSTSVAYGGNFHLCGCLALITSMPLSAREICLLFCTVLAISWVPSSLYAEGGQCSKWMLP